MTKLTHEYTIFENDKGIDVYFNELTGYIIIARRNEVIYEFYDGDTWDNAVKEILYNMNKY